MKRVLFILNNLNGGGAERVIANIANGYVVAGHEATILLGKEEGIYFDMLDKRVKIVELGAITLLDYCRYLPKFLKKNSFSHVITASDYISCAAIFAKFVHKIKVTVIATLHYDLPSQLKVLPKLNCIWLKLINKMIIVNADKIIAVSTGVASGFISILGRTPKHLAVIYNPVFDDNIYELAKEEVIDFSNRIKCQHQLVCIGRLDIGKNQKLLVEAVNILSQKGYQLLVYLIGEGSQRNNLQALVNKYDLQKSIRLIGFQNNPFKYLSKSDLLVSSSNYEGLPTTLVEALALGINVVSTDCPSGPNEILEHGKYGFLCPVEDPLLLSDAIERALKTPIDSAILKQRAQAFSIPASIQKYLDVIQT